MQERNSEYLVQSIARVKYDYAHILTSYNQLVQAPPAEHSFYLNRLKCTIIETIEQNRLPFYDKSLVTKYVNIFCKRVYLVPLEQFKREYVDDVINSLSFPATKAKGHPSVPEAERLIRQFREMRRILS